MAESRRLIILPKTPVERFVQPFNYFFQVESAGGLLLLTAALVALIWSNSPWAVAYQDLWHIKLTIGFGDWQLSKFLYLWINDALMAVFFLVVGLEIKRELLVGELNSLKKASFPLTAALGGMVVPAALFTMLNIGTPGESGWGIPMATDIAFALGILSLVARGVPVSVKIFLTALAIIDDLGAVMVIALFYTGDLHIPSLIGAGSAMLVLILMNRVGVRNPSIYFLIGMIMWFALLKSGVHATLAGVLLATTIPARTRLNSTDFSSSIDKLIGYFRKAGNEGSHVIPNADQNAGLVAIETAARESQSPMQRMENRLHPWVVFVIMPVFALANAGVALPSDPIGMVLSPTGLGVIAGLFIGKPVGILLFTWVAVRLGWTQLPDGVTWAPIVAVSFLAGIGFTMSLFIGNLAFPEGYLLDAAKAGILIGSLLSGLAGWFLFRRISTGK
ncbi:MAG: Na+/H+ antiporter NhaA [Bacteroidetes bacterium]|nr:Na+/H+ antiporter NhaA [Bacteroidota bacterium]